MAVGPPLAGSCATFFCGVCKELFVYMKHKRKRAKDLFNDFAELRNEVNNLKARWDDIDEKIESQSWFIQNNNQFTALKNKVLWFRGEFEKIEQKYTMYCKNPEIQNQRSRTAEAGANVDQAAEASNAANVDQAAKASNGANINQAVEASNGANVDQVITNAPAREFAVPSNDGQQKKWTLKIFKLAQLDKDIVKLIPKIISVKNEIRIEDLIHEVKLELVVRMKADELKDIIPPHEQHLANLKEYLCRENCKRIGIYGAPGVGITNIMKNLNNCFDPSTPSDCELELDYVIWVAVPCKPTKKEMIENIQRKIIQRLNIDLQKYKSLNPADIISAELSKKKYLLLLDLDDFSWSIKLEKIGIREEHKDGKVVIAGKNTRTFRNVKLDESFEVKQLSFEDSKKLFNKFVEIDTLSEVQKNMVDPILKQIGGLPVMIRSAAEYLKEHRNLEEHRRTKIWAGFKQILQSNIDSSRLLGLGGLEKSYRIFYEELEDSFKKCLLYAALFPSGHMICKSTLVECWKAEEFLNCSLLTMEDAQNEGEIVFTGLEKRYLLQSCCEGYVKMEEFFRKIALVLPFPGDAGATLIVRGPEIDGHLEEREWKAARRVSLMGSKLKKLPLRPQCDRISTLLLQLNPELIIIPDSFLRSVKTLRVLDLQTTGITLLPPSISNLTALQCLYLNNCGGLTKLPPQIAELKELEVLDIQGTSIPCLPKEIRSLISLRCLRISIVTEACNPNPEPKGWMRFNWLTASAKSQTWVIFPPGIADKLHKLEELTIALGRTGISEEIRNRIQMEVNKSTKVIFIDPCIQRPFQSLDQENAIQSGEGTNLSDSSFLENPDQDLTTGIQLPTSGNEGPSCPQSGSTRGRTDSNYQASKKDKGKGIAIPFPKNKAIGVGKNKGIGGGIKFREPETNERASGDDVDLPNSSARASASGTTGRAD